MNLLDQLIELLCEVRPNDKTLCCIITDDTEIKETLAKYGIVIELCVGITFCKPLDTKMQKYTIAGFRDLEIIWRKR